MKAEKIKCPTCGSGRYEHPLVFLSKTGRHFERDTESFKCLKCGAMYRRKAKPVVSCARCGQQLTVSGVSGRDGKHEPICEKCCMKAEEENHE